MPSVVDSFLQALPVASSFVAQHIHQEDEAFDRQCVLGTWEGAVLHFVDISRVAWLESPEAFLSYQPGKFVVVPPSHCGGAACWFDFQSVSFLEFHHEHGVQMNERFVLDWVAAWDAVRMVLAYLLDAAFDYWELEVSCLHACYL